MKKRRDKEYFTLSPEVRKEIRYIRRRDYEYLVMNYFIDDCYKVKNIDRFRRKCYEYFFKK